MSVSGVCDPLCYAPVQHIPQFGSMACEMVTEAGYVYFAPVVGESAGDYVHTPRISRGLTVEDVLRAIVTLSDELIINRPKLQPTQSGYDEFGNDPLFSPATFLEGFVSRSKCNPIVVLAGFYYLKKIKEKFPQLPISSNNASRLVLVAACCAAKFLDDNALRYRNRHWVRIGGGWLSVRKFNTMEKEFLSLLEYSLAIDAEEFASFCFSYDVEL